MAVTSTIRTPLQIMEDWRQEDIARGNIQLPLEPSELYKPYTFYLSEDGKMHPSREDALKHDGYIYKCKVCDGTGKHYEIGDCDICNGLGKTKRECIPIYKTEIVGWRLPDEEQE